jgi:hypothetical protein
MATDSTVSILTNVAPVLALVQSMQHAQIRWVHILAHVRADLSMNLAMGQNVRTWTSVKRSDPDVISKENVSIIPDPTPANAIRDIMEMALPTAMI